MIKYGFSILDLDKSDWDASAELQEAYPNPRWKPDGSQCLLTGHYDNAVAEFTPNKILAKSSCKEYLLENGWVE